MFSEDRKQQQLCGDEPVLISTVFAALLFWQDIFPGANPVGELPRVNQCVEDSCELSSAQFFAASDALKRFNNSSLGTAKSIVVHGRNSIEVTIFFHNGSLDGARTYIYSSELDLIREYPNR